METNKTPTSMPEHLSALLDDEAGSFEQKRVLDELSTNDALRDKLSTYALIGETMRSSDVGKPMLNLDSSFLAGIHAKIEEEEQYHDVQIAQVAAGQSARSQSWIKPLGSFALVASVAAVAVVGLQNFQQSRMAEPSALVASNNAISKTMIAQKDQLTENEMSSAKQVSAADLASNNVNTNSEPMAATQEYAQADTQTRSLLKRYVDSHMQYASTAAFVPSVRVIAYTDNQ
ncbi:hypothetical protein GCM10009133_18450 [Cocleimonas flava]|uniref:Anti sigma-E protein RseA n=1 Tax=Cocleimonas flava TaxID=634765 RepID=A0A4R1EY07_9GAMM|nr:sigma-E factor negative regulatory protein [Cocleimonas flava]TCJ84769.1 anti sigma-E protein RseA [Cocleimonas flava]